MLICSGAKVTLVFSKSLRREMGHSGIYTKLCFLPIWQSSSWKKRHFQGFFGHLSSVPSSQFLTFRQLDTDIHGQARLKQNHGPGPVTHNTEAYNLLYCLPKSLQVGLWSMIHSGLQRQSRHSCVSLMKLLTQKKSSKPKSPKPPKYVTKNQVWLLTAQKPILRGNSGGKQSFFYSRGQQWERTVDSSPKANSSLTISGQELL